MVKKNKKQNNNNKSERELIINENKNKIVKNKKELIISENKKAKRQENEEENEEEKKENIPEKENTEGEGEKQNNEEKKMDIETIILNMRIISEIKENEKLVANSECLEIDTRYIQSIQRWWYADGRQNALIKISNIVNKLFEFIDETYGKNNEINNDNKFKEDKTHLFQRIHIILLNSIKGLNNLKITYKNDIKTITKIELIIEKISIKIEIMGSKIKLV